MPDLYAFVHPYERIWFGHYFRRKPPLHTTSIRTVSRKTQLMTAFRRKKEFCTQFNPRRRASQTVRAGASRHWFHSRELVGDSNRNSRG